jgi:hypothetical protein
MRSELEKRLAEAKSKVVKMLSMRPFPRRDPGAPRSTPPAINVNDGSSGW